MSVNTQTFVYLIRAGSPVNTCVNESGSVPLLMIVDSNSVSVFGSLPHIVE